jgi:rare lipoprotein A (peptidoglycan hydrolase)
VTKLSITILAAACFAAGLVAGQTLAASRSVQQPVVAGPTEAPLFVSGPVASHPADRPSAVTGGGASLPPGGSARPASPTAAATPQPTPTVLGSGTTGASVSGIASWYAWHAREAAAGPALRAFLGPHWRGTFVAVCAKRCIWVRLTDFCQCYGVRVIDLNRDDFAKLAPLSAGLIQVQIIR